MSEVKRYLKWLSLLCGIMGLFGIGVLLVGYKDPSFGRVATIACLLAGSAAMGIAAARKRQSF